MKERSRVAELQYSPDYGRIEVLLPHGSKLKDFAKISDRLFSDEILGKLPRGCDQCTSGESALVRERLEHVIQVDLDSMRVIG